MKKRILPFTINVEMRAYYNKSFPLGIIKSHIPGYDIWLCNKLINCTMRASGSFDSYEQDIWSENDGLTTTQATDLNDLVAEGKMFDIVNRNREMLKAGIYITGTYNEYFIPGKSAYKRNDFRHDYVIFGYDDVKRVFNSAAYFPDGSYRFYEMDYDAYYDSIESDKYRVHYMYAIEK